MEKEFALLFMVHDENQSWYFEDNIRKYLNVTHESAMFDAGFHESNLMHGKTTQRDSEHDSRFKTEHKLKRIKHRHAVQLTSADLRGLKSAVIIFQIAQYESNFGSLHMHQGKMKNFVS